MKKIIWIFMALAVASVSGNAIADKVLKISHQFPGGTIDQGDFRDRLVRLFAKKVEEKTKGSLKFEIYPSSSLMKTNAQFDAMRKGALDLSLFPFPYAGGEVPEMNIGLMPGIVTDYAQGARWKSMPVGKELERVLADKGIVMVSWIWQAGGVASRTKPIIAPEDAKGLKIRGGSREMDTVLKKTGAATVTMSSDDIYVSMQTGAIDAALTSSTSLISFKLEEVAKNLTTGRNKAYWFMLEPLMMSKTIFDKLTKEEQEAIMSVGAELEAFGTQEAKSDDQRVAEIYKKAGRGVFDIDEKTVKQWQDIARETAWLDYANNPKCKDCAKILKLAQDTLK